MADALGLLLHAHTRAERAVADYLRQIDDTDHRPDLERAVRLTDQKRDAALYDVVHELEEAMDQQHQQTTTTQQGARLA